jgi:hypothetical protein
MLSRIAELSGAKSLALQNPLVLEEVVAELWFSGVDLAQPVLAPPTMVSATVWIHGRCWDRSLVTYADMSAWGHQPARGREAGTTLPSQPAAGVSLDQARALAADRGGRLPRLHEWAQAVADSAAGNHGMHWATPSASGAFPATGHGLLDGWGNLWEWTEEGQVVGGSFASPACPQPRPSARLVGFRVVFDAKKPDP